MITLLRPRTSPVAFWRVVRIALRDSIRFVTECLHGEAIELLKVKQSCQLPALYESLPTAILSVDDPLYLLLKGIWRSAGTGRRASEEAAFIVSQNSSGLGHFSLSNPDVKKWGPA